MSRSTIEVRRLHLTDVTPAPNLPWARPTFPVFSYLVLHRSAPILIDTGVGVGNAFIDELYSPVHYDLEEALGRHGVGIDDIANGHHVSPALRPLRPEPPLRRLQGDRATSRS